MINWRDASFLVLGVFAGMIVLLWVLVALVHAASDAERAAAQVRAFRKVNACPSTGKMEGPCADWLVNHIVPLCWGGADIPANMEWQRKKESYIRDKFEREACAMKKKHEVIPFSAPLK